MSKKIKYQRLEDVEFLPEEFSQFVDDYIYNPVTNQLTVSPVKKDVQAYIESFADSSLDVALDKFLNVATDDQDEVADVTRDMTDLAVMAEMYERAEEYREKFGLSDDMSISQIYGFVGDKSAELADYLKKIQNGGKENVETEKNEEKSE